MKHLPSWAGVIHRGTLVFFCIYVFIRLFYLIDLFRTPELSSDQEFNYSFASFSLPIVNENIGLYYSISRDQSSGLVCCEQTGVYFGWHQSTSRFVGDFDTSLAIIAGSTSSNALESVLLTDRIKNQLIFLLVICLVIHSLLMILYILWGGKTLHSIIQGSPFESSAISSLKKMGSITCLLPLLSFIFQFLLNNVPESFAHPLHQFRSYKLLQDYTWDWTPLLAAAVLFLLAKAFEAGKQADEENKLTI
ncbi:MAG: hypothetical protein ACO2ZZ_03280 [Cyclobacteriaceae bacterium]